MGAGTSLHRTVPSGAAHGRSRHPIGVAIPRQARYDIGQGGHDAIGATRASSHPPEDNPRRVLMSGNLPFRADHVGSILRTAPLKGARAQREAGSITPEQLKAVED